jgi:uncharacterized phage infection (PIP) family protein YhgE
MHIHHHYYHHSPEARCEVMRRLEEMSEQIDLVKETIMATLEELTGVLATISSEVDKVSADTDNLLAQLANIPTGGLSPEQQAAIDSAVQSATAIADRLKAIDDKVPDAA